MIRKTCLLALAAALVAIALRFAEGSSVGDIARVLDVSDGAVRDDDLTGVGC
mgnify:CR=1 FL=1